MNAGRIPPRRAAMSQMPTGPLQAWLGDRTSPARSFDDSAADRPTLAPVDTTLELNDGAAAPTTAPPAAPLPPLQDAEREKLDKLERRLTLLRGKAALQRDPAWLHVLSPVEAGQERWAALRIRGMQRRQQVAAATAAVRFSARERRGDQEIARLDLADRLWQRRALARRARLLDPVSKLASQQRTARQIGAALFLATIASLVWTSVGVHDALVGPDGSPLAYLVEGLFAVPLLVLMGLRARAALWGRSFPAATARRRIAWLEGVLLFSSIAINTTPVLPVVGEWRSVTTLLAHAGPPVLVLVLVWLQATTSAYFAQLLADAHVDVLDNGGTRLSSDAFNVMTLVKKIQAARSAGELPDWESTGLPSVSAIARYFTCEKRRAQEAHDALELLNLHTRSEHAVSSGEAAPMLGKAG
ncbi:hypothetical protein [Pseudonocardia sp. WMMC193]|uniref:hypothetical protein n=1 Tax=Pseudonocardia sp. WMMC193 TaxID=2911965 RepID=UPI001F2F4CA9|nr:hypothetical protein [Pseudonocardia sp. WMMC193]MCF7547289.1 hypothetical protein [Pseudonocardia sp. WMMC193]MCF7547384.1 hypothetical protein [Pseudonocardia sp. WMMC193]